MEYKIASFNMNNFGFTTHTHKDLDKIAEIIVAEDLDVVALQEISSEGKGVERLKEHLYGWDSCWDLPHETSDPEKLSDMVAKKSRGEGYAYLWNKTKFKILEYSELGYKKKFKPRIINSESNDVNVDCTFFARTPYYIRLEPLYGGFYELRLINIHIRYSDDDKYDSSVDRIAEKRKREFEILTKYIYPEISEHRYGQNRAAYTIAMGDYNLNIHSPAVKTQASRHFRLDEKDTKYVYRNGRVVVNVLTVQEQLTTLKNKDNGYANNYDHFTYSPELLNFVNVSYKTIDAVEKYCGGDFSYYRENISDHLPIVMTIEI